MAQAAAQWRARGKSSFACGGCWQWAQPAGAGVSTTRGGETCVELRPPPAPAPPVAQVVLFAVPGAFTPTCSLKHLPGFIEKADEFKTKGVDTIACISVNDAFVMVRSFVMGWVQAWAARQAGRARCSMQLRAPTHLCARDLATAAREESGRSVERGLCRSARSYRTADLELSLPVWRSRERLLGPCALDCAPQDAWGKSVGADGKVLMLADGSAIFTKAIDAELDLTDKGLGTRSRRYAMLVDDGVVKVRAPNGCMCLCLCLCCLCLCRPGTQQSCLAAPPGHAGHGAQEEPLAVGSLSWHMRMLLRCMVTDYACCARCAGAEHGGGRRIHRLQRRGHPCGALMGQSDSLPRGVWARFRSPI